MAGFLEELSERANESTEAALQAQLQVIRYIQSPKLYDSSFDLLFKNLKKALKYADSPRTREMIQERATACLPDFTGGGQNPRDSAKNRRSSCRRKLYKNRETIGKSDLIAGLIDRYASDMTEYFCGNAVSMPA